VDGSCEYGNKPTGSVKYKVLEWMQNWRLLTGRENPMDGLVASGGFL
jgi:hypothetical protein